MRAPRRISVGVWAAVCAAVLLLVGACDSVQPTVVTQSPLPSAVDVNKSPPVSATPEPPRSTVSPLLTPESEQVPMAPAPTESEQAPVAPVPTEGEQVPMAPMPTNPTPSNSGLERLVAQAKEDLAGRLAIDVAQIDLVEIEPVTWPDGSLGCPQPGMRYIQVPQDGALILLAVEGRVYEYHSGGGRDPFLCELKPLAPKPVITPIDIVPPGSGDE